MSREKLDPQNMYKSIFDFPDQIEKSVEIGKNVGLRKSYSKVKKIVFITTKLFFPPISFSNDVPEI